MYKPPKPKKKTLGPLAPLANPGFTPYETMVARTILDTAPVFPYGIGTDTQQTAPAPTPTPAPVPTHRLSPYGQFIGDVMQQVNEPFRKASPSGWFNPGLQVSGDMIERIPPAPKPIGTLEQLPYLNTPRGLNALQPSVAPSLQTGSVVGRHDDTVTPTSLIAEMRPSRTTVAPEWGVDTGSGLAQGTNPLLLDAGTAPVRNRRDEAKGALWSLLGGGVLGGLLGGGSGAIAGAGAAGQGFMKGADTAFDDRMNAFQQEQQNAFRQNQLIRQDAENRQRQTNEDRDYQLGLRRQSGIEAGQLSDDRRMKEAELSRLTPESRRQWIQDPRNRAELDRLGIGYTASPDGTFALPDMTRATPPPKPISPLQEEYLRARIANTQSLMRNRPLQQAMWKYDQLKDEYENVLTPIERKMEIQPQLASQWQMIEGIASAIDGGVTPVGGSASVPVVPTPSGASGGQVGSISTPVGRVGIAGGPGEVSVPVPANRGAGLGQGGKPKMLTTPPSRASVPGAVGGGFNPNAPYGSPGNPAMGPNGALPSTMTPTAYANWEKQQYDAAEKARKEAEGKQKAKTDTFRKEYGANAKRVKDIEGEVFRLKTAEKVKDAPETATRIQQLEAERSGLEANMRRIAPRIGATPPPDREAAAVNAFTDFASRGGFFGPGRPAEKPPTPRPTVTPTPAPSRPINPVTQRPIPPQDTKTGRFLPEQKPQQPNPVRQGKQTPRSMAGKPQKAKPQRTEGTLPGGGKWRILPD